MKFIAIFPFGREKKTCMYFMWVAMLGPIFIYIKNDVLILFDLYK